MVTNLPATARRLTAVVLLVVAVRLVVGVWPAAVLGAAVALVVLVRALAALDHATTCPAPALPVPARALPVERGPRGPGQLARLDGQHVAFARGLAGLADWYLTECETETNR